MITTLFLAVPVAEYKFSQFYVSQFSNLVISSMQVLHGIVASSHPCPYFFSAMLCSFLQSSCRLFNCSQFSSFAVAVIHSCCHVIDLKFTLVRILPYVSLLEVNYCFSFGRNVQLATSSEESKNSLGGEKSLLPLKFIVRQTRILKRRSFLGRNHHRWWINTARLR
jgi:hypothetical protein